jgi:nicotinamide-nucleotide amidase
LGPTRDDITKATLCKFFDTHLVFNESVFENVQRFLKGRVANINALNRGQAMVPQACTVIPNVIGTAPVMWFDHEGKVVVSIPGVPHEMKRAMSQEILPRLKERFQTEVIRHKTILVYNVPEAVLAERLTAWEEALPEFIKLAYLPAPGRIRLRLTASGQDEKSLNEAINQVVKELYLVIGPHIYGEEDVSTGQLFASFFSSKKNSLAVAESCSGGFLAHLLTAVPGASHYFLGGVVAYSNHLKKRFLGVDDEALVKEGAVSQVVVEQMALGIQKQTGADYAIATSGIAGPEGGSDDKPVGTVWIAWAGPEKVISRVFNFGSDRKRVIERTSEVSLIELMQMMKNGML